MKKMILTALGSILLATLLSFLYFYFNRAQMAMIGYGIYGFVYVLIQFFAGWAVHAKDKDVGLGVDAGSWAYPADRIFSLHSGSIITISL